MNKMKFVESSNFKIKDAYVNSENSIDSDVYYWYVGEDVNKTAHIAHLVMYCDDGDRYICIIWDVKSDMSYSVLEFNYSRKLIASETFKNFASAKKYFKEII